RHTSDRVCHELVPVDDTRPTHELPLGEVLAHLEADAELLDGDPRRGQGAAEVLEYGPGVEGHLVDDGVARGSPLVDLDRHGSVGTHGEALPDVERLEDRGGRDDGAPGGDDDDDVVGQGGDRLAHAVGELTGVGESRAV